MKFKIGDIVKTTYSDISNVGYGIIVETHGIGYYRIKFFNSPHLKWYEEYEIEPA